MKNLLAKIFGRTINVIIANRDLKMVREYQRRGYSLTSKVLGGKAVWVASTVVYA